MIAPDTAPQIFPVRDIPAPKPHPIFFAVSGSRPNSSENVEKTEDEHVNLLIKHRNASSDLVMNVSCFYQVISESH
jgi:hypothetical protein